MIDLKGHRFGKLCVIDQAGRDKRGEVLWLCACDCGYTSIVLSSNLRTGNTRSCGCERNKAIGNRSRKHGMSREPMYYAWQTMKQRCHNPRNNRFEDYGARGVTVCDRWREDFTAFLADMGERPEGTALKRRETDGNYEPKNCRWVIR